MLNEQQLEWAKAIKAKSTENLPLAVQADVRDWLWDKLVAQYGEKEALTICLLYTSFLHFLARHLLQICQSAYRLNTALPKMAWRLPMCVKRL